MIINLNPDAKVLMNDLGTLVLDSWASYLRSIGFDSNLSFAGFDATQVPIKDNMVDIAASFRGFSNISHQDKALAETFRILKPGGVVYLNEMVVPVECFDKLPSEVKAAWVNEFPSIQSGWAPLLEDVGFEMIEMTCNPGREIRPDEGELGRMGEHYGVVFRTMDYAIW